MQNACHESMIQYISASIHYEKTTLVPANTTHWQIKTLLSYFYCTEMYQIFVSDQIRTKSE